VPREQTARYGIVDIASDDGEVVEIRGMVEKPAPEAAPSTASIIGRYILQPEVFAELDRQEAGVGGEIQLTDSLARLLGRTPFHGLRFKGQRFDCGSKAGFLKASIAYAMKRPELRDELKPFLAELLRRA
jgi:UTP--glucose-1-phosphate uridylyltransferase